MLYNRKEKSRGEKQHIVCNLKNLRHQIMNIKSYTIPINVENSVVMVMHLHSTLFFGRNQWIHVRKLARWFEIWPTHHPSSWFVGFKHNSFYGIWFDLIWFDLPFQQRWNTLFFPRITSFISITETNGPLICRSREVLMERVSFVNTFYGTSIRRIYIKYIFTNIGFISSKLSANMIIC